MEIFLNYGGAGSHHGGAGRITPNCDGLGPSVKGVQFF